MIEPPNIQGLVNLRSQKRAAATLNRLEALVRARGLTVFARIEFSRDAESAGLALSPMAQLVVDNPRAGPTRSWPTSLGFGRFVKRRLRSCRSR